jgi:hypothetical protein
VWSVITPANNNNNQINDYSAADNAPQKWGVYRNAVLNLSTIEMTYIGSLQTCRNEEQFLYESDLSCYVAGNEKLYNELVNAMENDRDLILNFDNIFNALFKTSSTDNNLILMSFFERLFLRILRKQSMADMALAEVTTAYILQESWTIDANINVMGVGIRKKDDGNNCDLPCGSANVISCSDREFSNFSRQVHQAIHYPLSNDFAQMILVRYLYGKVTQMFDLTKHNPIFTRGRRNIAFRYLASIKEELTVLFNDTRSLRVQFFELVGESGIGKSQSVSSFSRMIHALVPSIPIRDLIYTRANDYWWNGYCGQPIILYDDFTHITKKMKFDLIFEVIAVASGTFRNPPMAFAKDTEFTSSFGFITSNIPICTTTSVAATSAALKRRIVSDKWETLPGLFDGEARFSGHLLNFIESKRNVFSLLSESIQIFRANDVYDFKLINPVYSYSELPIPFEIATSKLTSSVSGSYSAMMDVDGAPCGTRVSAQIDSAAQINTSFARQPMVSLTRANPLKWRHWLRPGDSEQRREFAFALGYSRERPASFF